VDRAHLMRPHDKGNDQDLPPSQGHWGRPS
jgi:hypothetical protein